MSAGKCTAKLTWADIGHRCGYSQWIYIRGNASSTARLSL